MAKEETAPKYGVADLAKKLGVADATARVMLRKAGVEKAGKSYGWKNDKELAAAATACRAGADEKPAAKPKAKATVKKKAA